MRAKLFSSSMQGLCLAILFSILPLSQLSASPSIITVENKLSSSLTVLGSTVIPYKEVTFTAQIPGRIEWFNGDVGTMVKSGDLLVKIDDDELQAKRRSVVAGLESAQAALKNAQAQYTREIVSPRSKDATAMPGFGLPAMMDIYITRPLLSEMMGDTDTDYNRYSDLVNSSTKVDTAKSQVMQMWAKLNEIDAHLKNSVAIAPFEGMILDKMIEVGDTVQPGQPLIKLGFVKYKRLHADVPSILIKGLKEGMIVDVRINGTTKTKAKVSQIYPVADESRHTVVVKFDLYTNIDASPGMYAEVYLPNVSANNKPVIVIPRSALLKGRSLPSVLLLNKQGQSELRMVRLGSAQGNTHVAVVSGLSKGDKIVDNPPSGVSSGWLPSK